MSDYRRYFVPGATYFFTVVTANRAPIFRDEMARRILGKIFRDELQDRPFTQVAIVLLPDHLHAIWTLPPGDDAYSDRWKSIKAKFTAEWLATGHEEADLTQGYVKQRRRGVWQPRFIEHTIRDETDLHNHADYLHWNPVKHRLVTCPKDWPPSSFHRFVQLGHYPLEWGCSSRPAPDFGKIDVDLIE